MKKIVTILFTLFLCLTPVTQVHAATFYATISGPSQITAGQEFTVTVGVANVTNMLGLSASFSYDSSKLTLVSSKGLNDFSLTLGTKLVVDRLNAKSGSFSIASLVFKAKTSFSLSTSAYVRIVNAQYSNGATDVDDFNTRQLTIKMVSDNSYLKTLTVSQGSLSFTKTTTDYVVIVENNTSSIVLGATADYSKSTISGLGTKSLSIYSNVFNIVVTAENGSKRTYKVDVQRKDTNGLASPPSSNNTLSQITIEGFDEFNSSFNKDTLEYTLNVGNLVSDLVVTAIAEDLKSKIEITQAPLIVGSNTIMIKVTAENGDIKTYLITVNRSSDVPTVNEDEIIAALSTVTTPSIGLNMPSSWEISSEILSALKTSGKTLIVVLKLADQTLYEWVIDGSTLIESTPIKVKITFGSVDQDKIDALTNYASGLVLNFEENLSLPVNTILRISVSPTYQDGDKINLYYYDSESNKMSLYEKDLLVSGGKVEIPLTHTSTYFLSQTQLKIPGILDYIFVLVSIMESFIIVLLLLRLRRPRKHKRALPEN